MRETEDNNNNDIGQIRTRVVSEQASLLQALMAFWHAMRKTGGDNPKFRLLTFVDSIDSVWRITKNLDDAENNPESSYFNFVFHVGVGIARRTLLGTIIVRRLG